METNNFYFEAGKLGELNVEALAKLLRRQSDSGDIRDSKRRRTNDYALDLDVADSNAGAVITSNDFVLLRDCLHLGLSPQSSKAVLNKLDEFSVEYNDGGDVSLPCRLQLNASQHELSVVESTKMNSLLIVNISSAEQVTEDIQLYLALMHNRKLCYAGSPLKVSNSILTISRTQRVGEVKQEQQCELCLEFYIALPNSGLPSFPAAELTTHPLYARLLRRVFTSLSNQQIDSLAPPKARPQRSKSHVRADSAVLQVNPVEFYAAICSHKLEEASPLIQHSDLQTSLLDYQRQTVQWCLLKEGKAVSDRNLLVDIDETHLDSSPWGWNEIVENGKSYWIAPDLGLVCKDEAQLKSDLLTAAKSGAKCLLAEEMGLGKSLETIALILLNQRPIADVGTETVDLYSGNMVSKAKTTLIVAPANILKQWVEEFEKHAPTLSVFVYKGAWNQKERISSSVLEQYDVVLTTYSVISREIHYTQKLPSRSMRHEPKYEVFRSPLIQLEFWRVVLDEVQLVETGVGKAAQVARDIPRFHAWGVSGTPVRNDLSDLAGLLQFLRYVPYIQGHQSKIWERLCFSPTAFCDFFYRCSIRHTKDMVNDSIALPPQQRIVLTIPFSTVEDNNYRHLFQQFLDDCGFRPDGSPLRGDWDPAEELPKMSRWLGRLRQTCCHPQIGTGNRRALGGGPLRTVNDVLEAMHDNALSAVLTEERSFWVSKIQRGQVLEQEKHPEQALKLWTEALEGIRNVLATCRKQLAEDLKKQKGFKLKNEERDAIPEPSSEEDVEKKEERDMQLQLEKEEEEGHKGRISSSRARVRVFLELEHRCLFFIASVHFQMENQELENEYYGLAEKNRRELLQESESRAQKLMDSMASMAQKQEFAVIPEIEIVDDPDRGLETRSVVARAHELAGFLNDQANLLDEWREKVIALLGQNLVDRDAEPDGEEYGESLDAQEECFSFQEAIRQVLADRNEAVNGVRNNLVEYDVARENQLDNRTELAKRLSDERKKVKPPSELGNFKLMHDELRRLTTQLTYDVEDAVDDRRRRFEIELAIASDEMDKVRKVIAAQRKSLDLLDKELLFFRSIYNARIEYYKQLQQISDGVAEFVPKHPENFPKSALANESRLAGRIDRAYARLRYLEHLENTVKGNAGNVPESERICVICQSTFEIGSLTVCGHQYCRDCILEWWKFHRSCPVCKKALKTRDIYNISYKPAEIRVSEEKPHAQPIKPGQAQTIYSNMSDLALNRIKAIDLSGSYGSKIDMILRHMLWLRETDSNAQVVVFSQWGEFLNLVGTALLMQGIRYASMDRNMEEFRRNPDIMCFLLHAKSQSSGLNLINATHVILCEPLFNTTLELQAISRIHRIGQTKPTTVWMYAINGTVEESILLLSTKRRLALLQQPAATDSAALTEASLDISNSFELQKAAGRMVGKRGEGEIVPQHELWDLFFGNPASTRVDNSVEMLSLALSNDDNTEANSLSLEYRRFMMEDAAKQRANGSTV